MIAIVTAVILFFIYITLLKYIIKKNKIKAESIQDTIAKEEPKACINFETQYLDKNMITVFRLDGHKFSKFTKNFEKPFSPEFTEAMKQTALAALEYYNFSVAYVGSDEITLCLLPKIGRNGEVCDLVINGRIQKMGTLLAGFVSVMFYKTFEKILLEKQRDQNVVPQENSLEQHIPHFDCRIFQIHDINDLRANIAERVKYTLKNSRMMFAQYHLSSKRLIKEKCSSAEAVELVHAEKGINFYETVDVSVRLGTVITYVQVECEKTVIVKGASIIKKFISNVVHEQNLSPREIADLII